MRRFCYIIALWACAAALCQNTESPREPHSIKLENTGHGYWKEGRPFLLRTYVTSDGTRADLTFLTFHSLREANQYIAAFLDSHAKVIYRARNKDTKGQVIGERIVAVREVSGKKDFTLIRRVGLNGYFIVSSCLTSAIEVEQEAVTE
ncbi:MAG TPA: hypothetical protein VN577_06670 [Terriglobales bacterium]|nr:hypothetical protein [Terriglobales bacterium]